MKNGYKILCGKYYWDISGTITIPTQFYWKPKSFIIGRWLYIGLGSSDNCVNMKWYGAEQLELSINGVNDRNKAPVFIENNVVYINLYYGTHTMQNVYDAFTDYYDSSLLTAEIYGDPNGIAYAGPWMVGDIYKIPVADIRDGTNKKNANFFSDIEPDLIEEIDLYPYLTEISNIEYGFENIDDSGTRKTLYCEASDVSLTLSGIKDGGRLINFFGIFEYTDTTKFLIRIFDSLGNLLFRGTVDQSSIKMPVDNISSSSETIKVQALGFEKEFGEYYSQETLEENVIRTPFPYVNNQTGEFALTWKYAALENVLKENFKSPFVNFVLDEDIAEYSIMNYPMLKAAVNFPSLTHRAFFLKSGYEIIRKSGRSKLDWLRMTCAAMGWRFFFRGESLYITNRNNQPDGTVHIGETNIIDFKLSKCSPYNSFSNIIIPDGLIWGGDEAGLGGRFRRSYYMVLSKNVTLPNTLKPWNYVRFNSPTTGELQFYPYEWFGLWGKYDDRYEFLVFRWKPGNSTDTIIKGVGCYDALEVDGGDVGDENNWTCDLSNGINHLHASTDTSGTDVWFRGCFGWALFKVKNGEFTNYEDYRKSALFESNFGQYWNTNTASVAEINVNGIFSNPNSLVEITSVSYPGLNGIWKINKLKFDVESEETTMEIQKQIE